MATIRKFCCNDLLRFTSVNLDHITVTTGMFFYQNCLAKWPDYFIVAVAPRNRIIGYIMGVTEEVTEEDAKGVQWKVIGGVSEEKSEGDEYWKGLVIAVNVASEYRRRGYGTRLMRLFEQLLLDKMLIFPWGREHYTFVYVLTDNTPAKRMFEQFGYEDTTRIAPNFYVREDEGQDANEMWKVLSAEEEPSLLQWSGYSQGKC